MTELLITYTCPICGISRRYAWDQRVPPQCSEGGHVAVGMTKQKD